MKTRNLIKEFLMLRRFAMVGVSRDPNQFSRRLFRELIRRGYDVIPVNPNAQEIDGKRCYARVQDITPRVTSALLITARERAVSALRDCAEAGVTLVWLYGVSGPKAISREALKICQDYGIGVVPGYCPYMFMPMTAVLHRVHGFAWKLFHRNMNV